MNCQCHIFSGAHRSLARSTSTSTSTIQGAIQVELRRRGCLKGFHMRFGCSLGLRCSLPATLPLRAFGKRSGGKSSILILEPKIPKIGTENCRQWGSKWCFVDDAPDRAVFFVGAVIVSSLRWGILGRQEGRFGTLGVIAHAAITACRRRVGVSTSLPAASVRASLLLANWVPLLQGCTVINTERL